MSGRRLLLGVDVGTSGTKTVLFTPDGQAVAEASRSYPMTQLHPGWAEQDPALWWDAVRACLRELTARDDVDPREIVSLGLSGQMHGMVLLDRDGIPTAPAILWCDTRVLDECAEIEGLIGIDRLVAITGNRALTNFTAPKYLWMRRHHPDAVARAQMILLPKDYIRFRLTGVCAAEPSDACGTLLYDTGRFCWSEELCTALGVDRALLPPLVSSAAVVGRLTPEAAAETGLPAGLPVVGGAGDNAAAAVGVGAVAHGRAFTTIGTSGNVYAHTKEYHADPAGRFHTYCSAVDGEWAYLGAIQAAGLTLRWFRENFCGTLDADAAAVGLDPYALLDREAAALPPGSDGLFFLPYLLGERTPHLDPHARGCFIGLRPTHGRAAMGRAVMEGVTFALADCLALFDEMGVRVDDMAACGGGGRSPLWRQMLADTFGCPIAEPASREGAALGAALLGGVGVGLYPNIPAACDAACVTASRTMPTGAASYAPVYSLWRELYPTLKASFARIDALVGR